MTKSKHRPAPSSSRADEPRYCRRGRRPPSRPLLTVKDQTKEAHAKPEVIPDASGEARKHVVSDRRQLLRYVAIDGIRPRKSGSHRTHRWREADSNSWSLSRKIRLSGGREVPERSTGNPRKASFVLRGTKGSNPSPPPASPLTGGSLTGEQKSAARRCRSPPGKCRPAAQSGRSATPGGVRLKSGRVQIRPWRAKL